jgi:hypothetical protein
VRISRLIQNGRMTASSKSGFQRAGEKQMAKATG